MRCPYCDDDMRDHQADCPLLAFTDQLLTVTQHLALTVCAVQELHDRAAALDVTRTRNPVKKEIGL